MTRVNIIDPIKLTDQHLIAERLELNFVISSAVRSFNSKHGLKTSNKFTLNTGHVIFFHDKMLYIRKRHEALTNEMIKRGMTPKHPLTKTEHLPKLMQNDYIPTEEDMQLIKERIVERINQKPSWYRYYGKSIGDGKLFLSTYYS